MNYRFLSQTKLCGFGYVLRSLFGYVEAMFSPLGSPGPHLHGVSQQEDSVLASSGVCIYITAHRL